MEQIIANSSSSSRETINTMMADDDVYLKEFNVDIYLVDVVLLLANLIGIIANVIILYIMLKSKSWRMPTHFLISSWAVLDVLHLITSPGLLNWYKQLHEIYYQYYVETLHVCMSFAFEVGIILVLFVLIYVEKIKFFKQYCKEIVCSIGCLMITFCILAALGTIYYSLHLIVMISSLIIYVCFLIVIVITCIVFFAKKMYTNDNDCELRLALVTTNFCCWLTFIVVAILMSAFAHTFVLCREIVLLVFALAEMNALANLYILVLSSKIFNLYFYRAFDWRRKYSDDKVNIVYENQRDEEFCNVEV